MKKKKQRLTRRRRRVYRALHNSPASFEALPADDGRYLCFSGDSASYNIWHIGNFEWSAPKKQALHKKSRIKQGAADVNGKEAKIALLNTPFSFFDRSLMAKPCQTVENPWSAREGRISLELPIVPGGVYSGCGAIESGGKSHFPEQKSFHCSFCVRKSERFQRKPAGGRELAPPSAGLSKPF